MASAIQHKIRSSRKNRSNIISTRMFESYARKVAEDYKMIKFLESSAKTGFNAQEMFIEAAKVLYVDYLKFNQNVY